MRFWNRLAEVLLFVVVIHLLTPGDAQAYLDPGSATFVFQVIAAFLLSMLVTLKIYWQKVKSGVRSLFARKNEEEA
jgi:hypothetical protein